MNKPNYSIGALLAISLAALIAGGAACGGLYHWLWLHDAFAGIATFGAGIFIASFCMPGAK